MSQLTPDQAQLLFNIMLPAVEREYSTTLRVIEAVPADKADYKPDANSMSAFEIAAHMASAEHLFTRAVVNGGFAGAPGEKPKTMADVVTLYKETVAQDLAALKNLSGEQLAKVIDFHGRMQMPAVMFLDFSVRHIVHHRGQLSVYLRPMGAKVPAIYGESYDSKAAKAAAPQG